MKDAKITYLLQGEHEDIVRCATKRQRRFEISRGNARTNTPRNHPCTRLTNVHELFHPNLNKNRKTHSDNSSSHWASANNNFETGRPI